MKILRFFLGVFFSFFLSFSASAATITVTSTADSGAGTLRQAVADANPGDTINFNVGGNLITLSSGQININKALTIAGPGEDALTIAAQNAPDRVFYLSSGAVTISDLTLQDGHTTIGNNGGCILTDTGAPLTLNSVTLQNCLADQSVGGAIYVQDDLTLTNCTLDSNSADFGGAIGEETNIIGTPVEMLINSTTLSQNAAAQGGALHSNGGTVTANNSLFIQNTGGPFGPGGAISTTSGVLILNSTTISSNTDDGVGGGIFASDSSLAFTDIAMAGNVGTQGGAIYAEVFDSSKTIEITRATISNNTANDASLAGGGIYFSEADLTATLTNVTLANNDAILGSGAGLVVADSTLNLNNVTVSGNTALGNGGGLVIDGIATVNIQNSIIAGNTAATGLDCFGSLTSFDYNLIEETASCNVTGTTTHNITGEDPELGPLQNNGGDYNTMALATTSPALNAANPSTPGSGGAACAANDERGVARPQETACDMGAFELAPGLVSLSASTYSVSQDAGFVTITVQRSSDSNTFDGSISVNYSTSDGTAVAGTNYAATSGTLTWASGNSTAQTVAVPIVNASASSNLTFNFALANPSGGASLISPSSAVVTITASGGDEGELGGGKCSFSAQRPVSFSFTPFLFILLSVGMIGVSRSFKSIGLRARGMNPRA